MKTFYEYFKENGFHESQIVKVKQIDGKLFRTTIDDALTFDMTKVQYCITKHFLSKYSSIWYNIEALVENDILIPMTVEEKLTIDIGTLLIARYGKTPSCNIIPYGISDLISGHNIIDNFSENMLLKQKYTMLSIFSLFDDVFETMDVVNNGHKRCDVYVNNELVYSFKN